MQESSRIIVGGLVLFLAVFVFGFVVHVSPRFPGSLTGSLIGITGALLMLVPLLYLVVKRVPFLKTHVTHVVSLRTLLAIHIYAGVLGPILGVIHSAHKFRSPLGVSLTGMMLVVVLSGYIGRYLLVQISTAIQGRRSELAALTNALDRELSTAASIQQPIATGMLARVARWFFAPFGNAALPGPQGADPVRLANAIADVEYAIRAEEVARDLFGTWLKLHIVIAMVLYGLLALHVWSGLYYGLRWLQ